MKNKIKQDYSYAFNETGKLINVKCASRGSVYHCPCCGEIMVPHMGKVRRWHFTHKSGVKCNYETYLHKIAKIKIREAIINSTSFFIVFKTKFLCNKECPFLYNYNKRCYKAEEKVIDIKKYYDCCEDEKQYNGFVADLLLYSLEYKDREPIFIEIFVTHKSTIEKIKSGNRIIEINITSEEDIDFIIENESINGVIEEFVSVSNPEKIVFYNFKSNYLIEPSKDNIAREKHVFMIERNRWFSEKVVSCQDNIEEKIKNKKDVAIISDCRINFQWAFYKLIKFGVNIKNCMVCRFYKHTFYCEKICVLYKEYNTPKSPNTHHAMDCPYFKLTDCTEEGTPIEDLRPGEYRCAFDNTEAYVSFIIPQK